MCYAKWENSENIKNNFETFDSIKSSGIPIYNENNLYYNTKLSNTLVIGNKESNKENNFILPTIDTIIKFNESVLIYDSNNLYEKTFNKFKDNGYKIITYDLFNLEESNKWNPLLMVYNFYKKDNDKAYDLLDEISYYILPDEVVSDPFWNNSARSYFKGLVLYMFNYEKEISFKKLIDVDELIKNNPNEFKEKLDKKSDIYNNIESILNAPLDTKMSIISVFEQKLKAITARKKLCEFLSKNDIGFENLDKTVIYLKSKTNNLMSNLLSMFISQLNYLMNVKGTKFNFILNNFNELYPINNIATILNSSLNNNTKFLLTINGFNELKLNYGKELAEMIKFNCYNLVYLFSNDYETLNEFSKLCGNQSENKALITIEELKTLKINEAIILIQRYMPIKTILKEN